MFNLTASPEQATKLHVNPIGASVATHTLIACWLGMVFDGMDTNNYILTMHPALKELIGTAASDATIGFHGALILALFMFGWAVGAVAFGLLADRIGRARTLVYTVVLYAVCTGLCAIVDSWQQLAFLRFLVGCGVGGEISIGGVILAELFNGKSRLHAAGVLQTGFPCGLLLLSGINMMIGSYGWRWLYVVGMIPAVLAIYMRMKLDDPEDFKAVKARRDSGDNQKLNCSLLNLFGRENLSKVLIALLLSSSVCVGAYAVLSWVPPWINQMVGGTAVAERSMVAMAQSIGNIIGAATAGFTVIWMGRRWAFRLAYIAALIICTMMFLTTKGYSNLLLVWAALAGCAVFAPFSYLFMYIPELFKTHERATAFAFCIQGGRVICAIACLTSGVLVKTVFGGSYAMAGATMALVYVLGLAATFIMPITNGSVSRQSD